MTYIARRNSVYYLNIRLPKNLFPKRHTLRLSLNLRDRKTALFVANTLTQRIYGHLAAHPLTSFEELRALCSQWRGDLPLPDLPRPPNPSLQPIPDRGLGAETGPTLAQLAKDYLEEGKRGGTWRLGSLTEVERALGDLFELLGDVPATSFNVEQARLLKDRLTRCPQYFALRPEFAGKNLLEVVNSNAEYTAISGVTVNNRLRKLSAFMNWCVENGYVTSNPLAGLKVKTGSAKEARVSFDTSDLQALLTFAELKIQSVNYPWRYWLCLLGRTTGARIEELAQLKTFDLLEKNGIWCIRIDDGTIGQQLKNSSSRRLIPIHSKLLELGFQNYVEQLVAPREDYIFPELEPIRGKRGHAASKWFSRYKTKMGVTDPKKTFHSFRHTLIDELRDAGTQDSLIKRIVGHEDGAVTFGVYGSRTPLNAMRDAIELIALHRTQA